MATNSRVGKTSLSTGFMQSIPDEVILVESALRRGTSLTPYIEPQSPSLQRIDIGRWKNAYIAAKDVENPNRNQLYEVYDNICIDNTLTSMIETRILKCIQAKFNLVDEKGKPNVDAKKLLNKVWFENVIRLFISTEFDGPALIETFDFDENGELIDCTRVDKYHVKPELGFVTKEPNDDKGLSFIGNPYYILVGDKKELGLLYKVAPHVLAKKFALGTWQEFNEKQGVPVRYVNTPSTDKARINQLGEIMRKMGSAGWAVLNDKETVTLLETKGTNPTQCFENLIKKLDSEPAMLIMGQSSTTNSQDNKGTYGSMQILQDISDDRHEYDLTRLANFLNSVLFPRLALLSPAYKVLEGLNLEWDKSVELTVKEIVDYVVKLSEEWEIDPEYITLKTGIPILGRKNKSALPPAVPSPAKKKNLTASITTFYEDKCCDPTPRAAGAGKGFEPDILRIARQLYDGKHNGVTDIGLLKRTAQELREGLLTGYVTTDDPKDKEMLKFMERNVFVFSGFKTHQQLREISDLLKDKDGNIRSFSDFKKDVLKVNQTYNVRYLESEYDHALVSAQAASQWIDIQRNKKTLPLLEFDATLDNRTTDTCRSLDGIRLPADNDFWNTYYIPLHWKERSIIRQVGSGAITDMDTINVPEIKEFFQNNVGKSGVVFPDKHPYYEVSVANKKQILESVNKAFPDPEDYKKVYSGKNGGSVHVHSQHNPKELKNNTSVGKILANNGSEVKLLDYVDTGRKNPDAMIGGAVSDFKNIESPTRSAVQNCIKSAATQQVSIAVITIPKELTNSDIVHALYAALYDKDRNKTITEVWFITNKKKLIKVNRKDISTGKLKNVL